VDLPIRLGFFLERTDVMFPFLPWTSYRGVDRLPFIPTPEEEDELKGSKKARLLFLWQRYSDLTYTGELHASQDAPRSLRGAFADEGIDFEVVYAEVAQMPPFEPEGAGQETSGPLLRRLRALHQQVASRPVGVQLLGYDVSHPLPSFHSFLFQPGLREEPEAPDLDINSAGLLDTIQQVEQILPVANSMASSLRPFCGIGVYFVA
jgi:hypothetical protein